MTIALFGATGGTGRELITKALEADHEVRALTRRPSKLSANEDVTTIEGNVLNRDSVEATIQDANAVTCLLGRTANNPDDVVSRGTENIINVMIETDIDRLIVVTSMGLGSSVRQIPWYVRLANVTVLHDLIADKARQEELVASSPLYWTIVRPGGLTNERGTGEYVHGVDLDVPAGPIPRADVAEFLLILAQTNNYLRQAPVVTTKRVIDAKFLRDQVTSVTKRLIQ